MMSSSEDSELPRRNTRLLYLVSDDCEPSSYESSASWWTWVMNWNHCAMVVISAAVSATTDKVTYSLNPFVLSVSCDLVAATTAVLRSTCHLNELKHSENSMPLHSCSRVRRASFTPISFARRRHYAVRRRGDLHLVAGNSIVFSLCSLYIYKKCVEYWFRYNEFLLSYCSSGPAATCTRVFIKLQASIHLFH